MRAPAPFHMALPMCTYLQMRLTMVAHCTHTAGKYDKKVTRAKTANVVRRNDQRVVVSLCPCLNPQGQPIRTGVVRTDRILS